MATYFFGLRPVNAPPIELQMETRRFGSASNSYLENSRNQCNQAPLSEVPMQDTIQLLHLLKACHIMQSRYANNPLCSEEVYSLWWLRSLPFWMRVIANISLTKHSRTSRSQRSNTWIMKLACIALLFGFFDSHESQW